METEYCNKCGLLHNPSDGDCLGCKMVEQIKEAAKVIKTIMTFDLRVACPAAREYLKKYEGGK